MCGIPPFFLPLQLPIHSASRPSKHSAACVRRLRFFSFLPKERKKFWLGLSKRFLFFFFPPSPGAGFPAAVRFGRVCFFPRESDAIRTRFRAPSPLFSFFFSKLFFSPSLSVTKSRGEFLAAIYLFFFALKINEESHCVPFFFFVFYVSIKRLEMVGMTRTSPPPSRRIIV